MNKPTMRWTHYVEAPQLARAIEQITIAEEDRAELQVRRFCWWLDLKIEDHGRSPAPFKQRVPDLHLLRGETCIARADTWVKALALTLGWSAEYLYMLRPCKCDVHAEENARA